MYFGVKIRIMSNQVEFRNNEQLKSDFAATCVKLLMKCYKEIKKRFNFSDPFDPKL